ncbi:hypothetical protein N3K66_001671 [Trichothecium roseum]|uniref:Uncharacterized protein n=1 Tax=Trichothecium roseum TaxID=47278 RepID=A0ACC0V7F6_9HYPO|nr:hypothetical protein N3K66_001671 [Trichothecium roseum]
MVLSPTTATDPGDESLQEPATDKSTTPRGDDNESAPAPTTAAAAATIDTTAEQGKMGRTHSKEVELQRKRARDRKSQQAMRNRTKWTIQSLTDQVGALTSAVDQRARDLSILEARARDLEAENAQLRTQNAALQLSLMAHRQQTDNSNGSNVDDISAGSPAACNTSQSHCSPVKGVNVVPNLPLPLWELVPNNTAPGCLADDILQTFVDKTRADRLLSAVSPMKPEDQKRGFPPRPDPRSLLGGERIRSSDQVSDVVAGIVKAYEEIQGLPRQVAVFFNMTLLVKWMIFRDIQSWKLLPEWLRPVPLQISSPHAAWIDRIPWPRAREHLIAHPEITLDDFVVAYSTGFSVNWPYDPASALLPMTAAVEVHEEKEKEGEEEEEEDRAMTAIINPVFEEHIRQMRYWTVGDAFHHRFPALARLIDLDSGQIAALVTTPSSPESVAIRP